MVVEDEPGYKEGYRSDMVGGGRFVYRNVERPAVFFVPSHFNILQKINSLVMGKSVATGVT